MKRELVIVIDFGGQYNQLVARRVRECNVYCEIYSYKTDLEKIKAMNPKGIILTGGPNSCYEADSPTYQKELFELGIPVLGLCYGAQLMMHVLGGKVEKADVSEYGKTELLIDKKDSRIFKNVSDRTICWMSHTDYISQTAPGFEIAAHTADCPVATAQNEEKKLYAIQFHPEVLHTVEGKTMLSNFVLGVCECAGDWKMDAFVEHTIKEIREKVGDGKVLLALSGGVDSSVAAGLLSRAIGKQLTCVFVDHGLLRKDEGDEVEGVFGPNGQFDLNFIRVNAQQRYYDKLAGVTEPEAKRKIIGEEFIRIFEEEAKKIGAVDFLAQGTIYPDVVESGLGGESAVIKSHHNVGGLPDFVDFKEIIEPLRDLFKDEVRKAGLELGIPERLVFRQPFPGPGLGIRIIGEVTEEKVRIVQDADYIYREEVDNAAADYKKEHGEDPSWMPNQYFAALTNMRSVGVMGDFRTYDYAVALRAVKTIDFMTAESAEFIRIFEEEAKKIGAVDFLAQGTIYPDVVESGLGGESAVIKSHHNVGGLPDFVDFKEIIEPLRDLFKDEVRKAGLELGIPERLVFRQPFPGPGLGIRIIGEVTEEKVRIVQDADYIYREEVDNAAADYKKEHGEDPSWMPNQYFAALTNMRSVGVMGDFRTYDYAVALRAVKTIDFMTAESAEIPYAVLNKVMNRIINEVKGVNRVFYDLTSKPPGTIEFE